MLVIVITHVFHHCMLQLVDSPLDGAVVILNQL